MRFSKAYIPTQKEAPSSAVLASHIFLSRAGFIQQVSAGVYNLLPLGKRVLDKITKVVKEELDRAGAQEVQLGFVTPAQLWQESGRYDKFGKELLRFKDRKENDFVLGPTHEEMMVNAVRDRVSSYKQLPLNLYQINLKFRDEARPRFGLMRGREFVMKDGYSFHSSNEDMVREFKLMEATYSRILERLELDYRVVDADSGAIGGSGSREFMALAHSGEDSILFCSSCNYSANIETAVRKESTSTSEAPVAEFNKFQTLGVKSINELSDFFKIDPFYTIKSVAKYAIYENSREIVLFCLRGDDELQEVKAQNSVGASELADIGEDELREAGLASGYMGPLDAGVRVVLDSSLKGASSIICGANEENYHYVGVSMSAIEDPHYYDLSSVNEGDLCQRCGEPLRHTRGVEVGHIFQLGDAYSKPLKANFLDENGVSKPFIMGTYGIGVSRLIAAIVEQRSDERGCIWTKESAPYSVNIMVSNMKNREQVAFGEKLYAALQKNRVDVIFDDRKERFGFKIRDAELIGFPYTIIVGKGLDSNRVEIMSRSTLEKEEVSADKVVHRVMELLE